jgi:hypothetical protein
LGQDFNPIQFDIGGLDINTTYQYEITAIAESKILQSERQIQDIRVVAIPQEFSGL